jgi:exodeoxyribonuclease-5
VTATLTRSEKVYSYKVQNCLISLGETLVTAGYPELTDHQMEVVSDIVEKMAEGNTSDFVASLRGPAGTGKTTLLVGLIIALDMLGLKVVVTSFTHKACSVIDVHMQTIGDYINQKVEPVTLHRLLNLKPQRAEYGKPETFTQSRPPELSAVDFVLVDECSMVGNDLVHHIEKGIIEAGIPILYAGDSSQLKPVNEDKLSSTFRTPIKYRLTEILRHDGAILNLATKIRTMKYLPQVGPASGGGTEVVAYGSPECLGGAWLESVLDPRRGEGTVMLTYMNKHRRAFNRQARIALMGEDAPRFIEGDTLLTLSPIMRDDKVLYSNNEDVHVVSPPKLLECLQPIHELDFTCSAWQINTSKGAKLFVLEDQDEIDAFNKYIKALGAEISKEAKAAKGKGGTAEDVRAAKRRWATEYFPLRAFFADVDFRYALTIHKSQGSTFRYVYINDDYRKARDQQQQLMYVAVTRASREVHHLDTRVSV